MTLTQLRPYQKEAVDAVRAGLCGGGRGQLLSACGTGKTVMSRVSVEQLCSVGGVAVILCPSVALVAQTLRAWTEAGADCTALAVCSDDTVEDSFRATAEISEPVTTDPDEVAKWLLRPSVAARRLIVGTHASAGVAGAGLLRAGMVADVLVIDEAHRTAGHAKKQSALVHGDNQLPAARRLYMTATPKIMGSGSFRGKTKGPLDLHVLSMDNEAVFGQVLYQYPFSRGIREGYLSDYRLAVIGVTHAEALDLLRDVSSSSRGDTLAARVHRAVVQTAIARAARQYDLRRILAFCPSIADARQFADTFPDALAALPDDAQPARSLYATHVHGGMSIAQRERILENLVEPPNNGWTVITNAKCLTEGVDVPAIDTVVFTAPKKSMVDIVQAVGRALRLSPHGNGISTIIVPILLPDKSDPDERNLDSGSYGPLWQVVRALRAHDNTFAAGLDACRGNRDSGKVAIEDDQNAERQHKENDFERRLEFVTPDEYSQEFLQHLTVRIVNSATSSWWDGYAKLQLFKAEHGHTVVPKGYRTACGFGLGNWVLSARQDCRFGELDESRIEALDALGFDWDPGITKWFERYEIARDYYRTHGHLTTPSGYKHKGKPLASWLATQRKSLREGRLSARQQQALAEIGLNDGTSSWTEFKEVLAAARRFYAAHGHLRIPGEYIDAATGIRLGPRLKKLRTKYHAKELPERQICELEEIGMEWDQRAAVWQHCLESLAEFHGEHGHLRIPVDYVTSQGFKLFSWLNDRRNSRRIGKLLPERDQALRGITRNWYQTRSGWE